MLAIKPDWNKITQSLKYVLTKSLGPGQEVRYPTNTYTFFKKDHYDIAIYEEDKLVPYIMVISAIHSAASDVERLIQKESVNSQIVWDLLEQIGVKEYSFNLIYKYGIPDQSGLDKIDWDAVQEKS